MPDELIYTSVPSGLKPGASGYCAAAATQGIATRLSERLEAMSGFITRYGYTTGNAAENPVGFQHLQIDLAGKSYTVLSRAAAAELDYTNRTNFLTCHLALGPNDPRPAAGPAAALEQLTWHDGGWDQVVGWRAPPRWPVEPAASPPAACKTWKALAGDAGWAGAIAQELQANPRQRVSVLLTWEQLAEVAVPYRDGKGLLPLVVEIERLLPPAQRWSLTFNTYFGGCGSPSGYRLRFVLSDLPEAEAARRGPGRCFDFTRPQALTATGPLIDQARDPAAAAAAEAEEVHFKEAPRLADEPPVRHKSDTSQRAPGNRPRWTGPVTHQDGMSDDEFFNIVQESPSKTPTPMAAPSDVTQPDRRNRKPKSASVAKSSPTAVPLRSFLASAHLTWVIPTLGAVFVASLLLVFVLWMPQAEEVKNPVQHVAGAGIPGGQEGGITDGHAAGGDDKTVVPEASASHQAAPGGASDPAPNTPGEPKKDMKKPEHAPQVIVGKDQRLEPWPPSHQIAFSANHPQNHVWDFASVAQGVVKFEKVDHSTQWRVLLTAANRAAPKIEFAIKGKLVYLHDGSSTEPKSDQGFASVALKDGELIWTTHQAGLTEELKRLLTESLLEVRDKDQSVATLAFQDVQRPPLESEPRCRALRFKAPHHPASPFSWTGQVVVVHIQAEAAQVETIAFDGDQFPISGDVRSVELPIGDDTCVVAWSVETEGVAKTPTGDVSLTVNIGARTGRSSREILRVEIYRRLNVALEPPAEAQLPAAGGGESPKSSQSGAPRLVQEIELSPEKQVYVQWLDTGSPSEAGINNTPARSAKPADPATSPSPPETPPAP